jgi:hypothetical protein
MNALDDLIPEPKRRELDSVDVSAPPGEVWRAVRYGNLARSSIVRALFAIRTLPARLRGAEVAPEVMRIDDIGSSGRPGFRILAESEREVVLGAIGKVWELDIPFADVKTAEEFLGFEDEGFAKVAWALRVLPHGASESRIEVEVRVSTTDEESWRRFRRYFRIIGPASRWIRHHLLASFAADFGSPEAIENERPLPGDELLPDAAAQLTHGILIRANPEAIWPWLVQMGCRRAGWYSYDLLDNAGIESAREIHPELQRIEVGMILPATPDGDEGFEVLQIDRPRSLILGGLFDPAAKEQRPFVSRRPERYWHITWTFVLEPLELEETRLLVRARAAFSPAERFHAAWMGTAHRFMEREQLRRLKERVEARRAQGDSTNSAGRAQAVEAPSRETSARQVP